MSVAYSFLNSQALPRTVLASNKYLMDVDARTIDNVRYVGPWIEP